MSHLYRFTVAGRGDFPFDMLRYDEAFPANTGDAMLLPYPTDEFCQKVRIMDTRREVRLLSHKMPTSDRWASFGWIITEFMGCPVVETIPF